MRRVVRLSINGGRLILSTNKIIVPDAWVPVDRTISGNRKH